MADVQSGWQLQEFWREKAKSRLPFCLFHRFAYWVVMKYFINQKYVLEVLMADGPSRGQLQGFWREKAKSRLHIAWL